MINKILVIIYPIFLLFLGRPSKRQKVQRTAWTQEDKTAISAHLVEFIVSKQLPGKLDIIENLKGHTILETRSWRNIKDFFRNNYLKTKK